MALSKSELETREDALLNLNDDDADYGRREARLAIADEKKSHGFSTRVDRESGWGGVNSGNEVHSDDFWNDPKTVQLYGAYVNSLSKDDQGRKIDNTGSLQYKALMDHQAVRQQPGYSNGNTNPANQAGYTGGFGTAKQDAADFLQRQKGADARQKREKEKSRFRRITPMTEKQRTGLQNAGVDVDKRLVGAKLGVSARIDNIRRQLEKSIGAKIAQNEKKISAINSDLAATPKKPSIYIHGDEFEQSKPRGLLPQRSV